MKYIYGPVQSRRLGLSLGISLTPHKVCQFDCVYCQLGATTLKTAERSAYAPSAEVLAELRSWLDTNPQDLKTLSFITLAGAGEPTLHPEIALIIAKIKEMSGVPAAVITNSCLLGDAAVRKELLQADLIIPSLDAAIPEVFAKINRPVPGVKIEDIIEGLVNLRKEYRGKVWLEIMLVKGYNDDIRHIRKLKEAIERINPDKIQLNSPVRSTTEKDISASDKDKLEQIKELLGEKAEIV
ncbi:MAG: radical SAM protein [Candidatus Omnitrophica bacterium]|nr:radical SAM protein [Candidatus Omnitrophota bacterium]